MFEHVIRSGAGPLWSPPRGLSAERRPLLECLLPACGTIHRHSVSLWRPGDTVLKRTVEVFQEAFNLRENILKPLNIYRL